MNTQEMIPVKKVSLWKLWFSMWIKPRATVRQAVETMSPVKVFLLMLMLNVLGNIWLNFNFLVRILKIKSLTWAEKRVFISWNLAEGVVFIPVIILGIWGFSWLLKSFEKKFKSQATLKEIFYANVWLASFWGIFAVIVICCIKIFFIAVRPSFDWHWGRDLIKVYQFVACVGFSLHYIVGLSEVMKISKARVVRVIFPAVLVVALWVVSLYIPRTIRNYIVIKEWESLNVEWWPGVFNATEPSFKDMLMKIIGES